MHNCAGDKNKRLQYHEEEKNQLIYHRRKIKPLIFTFLQNN